MMDIKSCKGCRTLQCFFRPVHSEEYPEIEHDELCFECYEVMTSEVNGLRADVDNGGAHD